VLQEHWKRLVRFVDGRKHLHSIVPSMGHLSKVDIGGSQCCQNELWGWLVLNTMPNYGVALTLLASRLYVVYTEHAVGRNTQGAQQLIFVLGRPPELGHVFTATRQPPLSGAPLHLACASSHEVLRMSDCRAASRAELHAPKIGARVSPAPLSALSKYRPFALPSLQR